jgi:hypothetical protein
MTKENYIKIMHLRNRCLVFTDENMQVKGLVTICFTNDLDKMVRKDIWAPPEEDVNGHFIYIDKCISDREQDIRPNLVQLTRFLNNKFPNKEIIWHSRGGYKNEIQITGSKLTRF